MDVTRPESVEAAVTFAVDTFGGLDLAVNNAGILGADAPTGAYDIDTYNRVVRTNLDGVFYSLRFELPAMEAAGKGGAIVNVASILGSVGFPGNPAYVAAKHGVVGLTKTAGAEYAAKGIRVNAVGPAFIDTPLLTLDKAAYDALVALHPAGRLGTAEEVAELIAFLLSERASFISGSYHLMDGSYTAV